MKDCGRFEKSIQDIIAGEPQLEQLEELVEHCKACRECRELFEMHRTVAHLGAKFEELETVDLSAIRASIIRKVAAGKKPRALPAWITVLRTPFKLQPITAGVLLALFFIFGLVSSRLTDSSTPPANETTAAFLASLDLNNLQNSPYSFTNVAVTPLANNRVSLSFDITRRVEIVDSTQSKMVKEVLMHSLFNPSVTDAVGYFQSSAVARPAF